MECVFLLNFKNKSTSFYKKIYYTLYSCNTFFNNFFLECLIIVRHRNFEYFKNVRLHTFRRPQDRDPAFDGRIQDV